VQTTTVIFMVLVLGVLWGGFAVLLIHSMKSDKQRTESDAAEGDRG
jgi:hypothetical protein